MEWSDTLECGLVLVGTEVKSLRDGHATIDEAYARIEGPKGEIGFYLISDGTANPYRYNVRPPSFVNLTCLSQIAVGHKLADAVVILGSFDIVMGEVDR